MFAFIQLMLLIECIGVVVGVYMLMRPVTSKFVFKYHSKLIFRINKRESSVIQLPR